MTAQALYYLRSGSLSHKVLSLSEETGALRASYALKLLVSEGRLSIASTGKDRSTGKLTTSNYETAGPVALVMTTTATEVDPELENRLVVLGVDESPEQTRAIVAAQREAATEAGLFVRTRRQVLRPRHRDAQRLLRSFPVVLAGELAAPQVSAVRHRRDHQKLLSIISALTLLHQHQREQRTVSEAAASVTYLVATDEDVARGSALAHDVLWRRPDQLAPQSARLHEAVLALTTERAESLRCDPHEVPVTRRELREILGWSDVAVRRATDRLVSLEYLVASGGGRGRVRTYTTVPAVTQKVTVGREARPTRRGASPGRKDRLVELVGVRSARHDDPLLVSDVALR